MKPIIIISVIIVAIVLFIIAMANATKQDSRECWWNYWSQNDICFCWCNTRNDSDDGS